MIDENDNPTPIITNEQGSTPKTVVFLTEPQEETFIVTNHSTSRHSIDVAEFEHMSNRMMETYALMNPRIIRKELVSRLHELVKDGFKYKDEKDGFWHQEISDRGEDSRGKRMENHPNVPVNRRR